MSHRIQSRRGNGRWQQNTMANTFGLSVEVCPHCGQCHPHSVNEPKPTACTNCGKSLSPHPQAQEGIDRK